MAKPTAQQTHALFTYFVNACEEATGKRPVANRNKSKWGLESLLMDYTGVEARELIDYYVEHYESPNIEWFLFNYEKVDIAKKEYEENKARSEARRKVTQKRLEEWRNRWQK